MSATQQKKTVFQVHTSHFLQDQNPDAYLKALAEGDFTTEELGVAMQAITGYIQHNSDNVTKVINALTELFKNISPSTKQEQALAGLLTEIAKDNNQTAEVRNKAAILLLIKINPSTQQVQALSGLLTDIANDKNQTTEVRISAVTWLFRKVNLSTEKVQALARVYTEFTKDKNHTKEVISAVTKFFEDLEYFLSKEKMLALAGVLTEIVNNKNQTAEVRIGAVTWLFEKVTLSTQKAQELVEICDDINTRWSNTLAQNIRVKYKLEQPITSPDDLGALKEEIEEVFPVSGRTGNSRTEKNAAKVS